WAIRCVLSTMKKAVRCMRLLVKEVLLQVWKSRLKRKKSRKRLVAMLHELTSSLPTLYSLKDIHALYKDEYETYAELYHDLSELGFELAYIDDSQKHYYAKKVEMVARRNADPSHSKASDGDTSSVSSYKKPKKS